MKIMVIPEDNIKINILNDNFCENDFNEDKDNDINEDCNTVEDNNVNEVNNS